MHFTQFAVDTGKLATIGNVIVSAQADALFLRCGRREALIDIYEVAVRTVRGVFAMRFCPSALNNPRTTEHPVTILGSHCRQRLHW
jgi:hypothetical protein